MPLFDALAGALVRGAILLALALVAILPLRRASSSSRRLLLTLALGGALVMPFVSAAAPAWHLGAMASPPSVHGKIVAESVTLAPRMTSAEPFAPGSPATPAVSPRSVDPRVLALTLWALGALGLVARLVRGLQRSAAAVRASTPAVGWSLALDRASRALGVRAEVRETRELDAPAVTGVLSPVVLVPPVSSTWSDARKASVLLHELAHVRQRDCLGHVVAGLALAVHWMNPLAWLALRRLREERELAADDAVIAAGARASAYAEDLLALAGVARATPHAALGMGEPSRLASRVAAILATHRARAPLGRVSTALLASFVTLTVVAIACASPDGPASASPSLVQAPATVAAAPLPAGTSIDPAIQTAADEELRRAIREWNAVAGVVVVLDPRTGEIRANAGWSHGAPADVATTTAYVTGSTLKAITLAAALDAGVVTPSDTFDCGHGSLSYGGQTIHDSDAYDTLGLPQVLAVSSNVGFTRVFDRLGGEPLARELHALHFGAAPGWVPERIDDHSFAGAIAAIGEAVTATPLQVALAYAAIANEGGYVPPTASVRDGPAPREQVMKPETARAVLAMLSEVVNGELGTGKLARIPGVRVAGKTGTAGWDRPDGREGRYASFVGVVPEASPRYVILVGIEQPRGDGSGGTVAAPVFARVATRALAAQGSR